MNLIKLLTSTIIVILLAPIGNNSIAQEVKLPIASNSVLIHNAKSHPESLRHEKNIQQALTLPFFDDFSTSYIYPDQTKWIGRSVYINDGFPVNPPSIGVATFDGLDSVGIPYENSSLDYNADTLTSLPIDLSGALSFDPTIYLSFFYQAAGNGVPPNDGDSLILQFRNKQDSTWYTVWEMDGNSVETPFQQVFIHIDTQMVFQGDTLRYSVGIDSGEYIDFRSDSFQFRFMNLVSGYGMEAIWNIDYVQLDNNRDSLNTTMIDLAFAYPGPSMLKNYNVMPWRHYLADPVHQMGTQYQVSIMNNDNYDHYKYFHSNIYEYGNPSPIYTFPLLATGYGVPFSPLVDTTLYLQVNVGNPANFTFPVQTGDFAEFPVVHYVDSIAGDIVRSNDTIKNVQRFADYYAYDDGSAEWGLGVINQPGGELAMQFTTTMADTCQGVYIFWPQMVYPTSFDDFSLAVWGDNGGQPGNLIYVKEEIYPTFDSTGLNGFIYYPLDSNVVNIYNNPNSTDTIFTTPNLATGTYYFGFIAGYDWADYSLPLAIGLDENSNWDSTKLWINTNTTWSPSTIAGTVMIRPVFGSSLDLGIKKIDNQLASSLSIFPNPASNTINLNWTSNQHIQPNDLIVQIYDPQERLILSQEGFQNQIDISSISEGFYLIKVTDTKTTASFTKKLIINR